MDSSPPSAPGLWSTAEKLRRCRWIDLSHSFRPGQPCYPGDPDQTTETISTVESDGFRIDRFSFISQWSTHIDAPGHRIAGADTLAEIDPAAACAPLVVIDATDAVRRNPDYALTVGDIREHEKTHGTIPPGTFVAVASGWSRRWEDPADFLGTDGTGTHHFPGIDAEAVDMLAARRKIAVLGHESPATDPAPLSTGSAGFPAHTAAAQAGIPLVEMMTNLDKVPATGAVVFLGFPVPAGATGFPVRVLAAVEDNS